MEQEQVRVGQFILGKEIGRGTFSRVRLATHSASGHRVAVKILDKAAIQRLGTEERVRGEIDAIRRCGDHPHAIRLYDVVDTPEELLLVNEYASGGSLYDHTNGKARMSTGEARRIFQQIVSGVEHCHARGIAHRDLKPENLLLDDNLGIKIADFGFCSRIRDGCQMQTQCGTPHYAAPEVISGQPYDGPRVDVWSCGIILFALLTGSVPFTDASIPNLFKKIKRGKYTIPVYVPQQAQHLILGMLEVDPIKRITIPEIRLNPWFWRDLPLYLHHPPEEEKHVVDSDVIDKVLQLPFDHMVVTRELVERAAAFEDDWYGEIPQNIRDVRCAYEIILDYKYSRLRAEEVARMKWDFKSWLQFLGDLSSKLLDVQEERK